MKLKKLIAAVLSAATVLSLAGCGNNEASVPTDALTSKTDKTSSSATSTSTAGSTSSAANSSSAESSTSSVTESKPQSASSKPETQPVPEALEWDNVPEASDDDFEYSIVGDLQNSYAYVEKYIGSAPYVKMPNELGGEKVIKLDNLTEWGKKVEAIMLSPNCSYTYQYNELGVWRDTNGIGIAPNVTEVVLPDNWTTVGLCGLQSLKKVDFPSGLLDIKYNAFKGTGLSSVTIPDSVKSIGAGAFEDCIFMSAVNFPESFDSGKCTIGSRAFAGCLKLKSIELPGELYCDFKVDSLFENCISLEEATLSDGCTYVVNKMFDGCTSLKEVNLPDGLQKIGESAFKDCTSLKSLTIPDSVNSIAQDPFKGCAGYTVSYKGQTFNEKNISKISNTRVER